MGVKIRPTLEFEQRAGYPQTILAGVDEVGRGCLAGPVVAGALVLPQEPPEVDSQCVGWLSEVSDSKLLTAEKREKLAPQIKAWARVYSIGVASVEEIDRLNIYHAAHLAMTRAVEGLGLRPDCVLIDGNAIPKELLTRGYRAQAVVKGDLKCLSIAAASVIAKVYRDQLMVELDQQYPGYGLAIHKGYATPAHQVSLKRLGAAPLHRRSFAPVAEVIRSRSYST